MTRLPPGVAGKEAYGIIQYILPAASDPRWQNRVKYTVFLKAYDTDDNKPGNDCGQASWSFALSGAASAPSIHLVE